MNKKMKKLIAAILSITAVIVILPTMSLADNEMAIFKNLPWDTSGQWIRWTKPDEDTSSWESVSVGKNVDFWRYYEQGDDGGTKVCYWKSEFGILSDEDINKFFNLGSKYSAPPIYFTIYNEQLPEDVRNAVNSGEKEKISMTCSIDYDNLGSNTANFENGNKTITPDRLFQVGDNGFKDNGNGLKTQYIWTNDGNLVIRVYPKFNVQTQRTYLNKSEEYDGEEVKEFPKGLYPFSNLLVSVWQQKTSWDTWQLKKDWENKSLKRPEAYGALKVYNADDPINDGDVCNSENRLTYDKLHFHVNNPENCSCSDDKVRQSQGLTKWRSCTNFGAIDGGNYPFYKWYEGQKISTFEKDAGNEGKDAPKTAEGLSLRIDRPENIDHFIGGSALGYHFTFPIKANFKVDERMSLKVRYIDSDTNEILNEEKVNGPSIDYNAKDIDGYEFKCGVIESSDVIRDIDEISYILMPTKHIVITFTDDSNLYLNIYMKDDGSGGGNGSLEPTPNPNDIPTSIEIQYIDIDNDETIITDEIEGEGIEKGGEPEDICIDINIDEDMEFQGYSVYKPDGTMEYTKDNSAPLNPCITVTEQEPTRIVKVRIRRKDNISASCGTESVITWTEKESHRVVIGRRKNGSKRYGTCNHTIKYRATLSADPVIIHGNDFDLFPDGDRSNVNTFNSGYGFNFWYKDDVKLKNVAADERHRFMRGRENGYYGNGYIKAHVKVEEVSYTRSRPSKCKKNLDDREPDSTVYMPTSVKADTGFETQGFDEFSVYTQPQVIDFVNLTSGGKKLGNHLITASIPRTKLTNDDRFNNTYLYRIYTPVSLRDGEHSIKIDWLGGGVNGKEFCMTNNYAYKIQGSMYDADYTHSSSGIDYSDSTPDETDTNIDWGGHTDVPDEIDWNW